MKTESEYFKNNKAQEHIGNKGIDVVRSLSSYLFYEAIKAQSVLDCFGRRIREEWLYGLLGQAVFNLPDRDHEVDFLLTEVPLQRVNSAQDEFGHGKVDFVFSYRGTLFLLELKSTFCESLSSDIGIPKHILNGWEMQTQGKKKNGVYDQLKLLGLENKKQNWTIDNICHARKIKNIVLLPVLFVTYQKSSNNEEKLHNTSSCLGLKWHKSLWESMKVNNCLASNYSEFESDIHQAVSRRRIDLKRKVVGYGLFAGDSRLKTFEY
jgi:hypothetical protein